MGIHLISPREFPNKCAKSNQILIRPPLLGFGRSLESVDQRVCRSLAALGPSERLLPCRGWGFFSGDAQAEEESRLRARAAKMARPHAKQPRTMGPGVEFVPHVYRGDEIKARRCRVPLSSGERVNFVALAFRRESLKLPKRGVCRVPWKRCI